MTLIAESKPTLGTFEELADITPEGMKPIAMRLRQLILDIAPAVCELVRLGDRAATYGVGPKKMSEGYSYIMPHSSWVNLGFYKGSALEDPEGLLEGTGAKMRHVKIRTLAEIHRPALKAPVEEALNERRARDRKKKDPPNS